MSDCAFIYYKDWMNEVRTETVDSISLEIIDGYIADRPVIVLNGKMFVLPTQHYSTTVKTVDPAVTFTIKNSSTNPVIIVGGTMLQPRESTEVVSTNVIIRNEPMTFRIGITTDTDIEYNGGIENIDFGDVEYDIDDIADVFNTYYRNWLLNRPFDEDFRTILQEAYNLNKEKIDRFYKATHDMNVNSFTTMKVEYGERVVGSEGYDYPLSGDISTSTPSTGSSTKENEKTDTTTVERSDNPIRTANDVEKLRTFYQMFVNCFKHCFTLFETMSW